ADLRRPHSVRLPNLEGREAVGHHRGRRRQRPPGGDHDLAPGGVLSMKEPSSTEELAALYKQGRLPLDAALERHFRSLGLWPVCGDFLAIQLVIGLGNLGINDKIVSLSGDRKLTVAQVIEAYKLRPFLEAEEKA